MLVLGRRSQEVILIGDNIRIQVVHIDQKGGLVKLGIDAPVNVNIRREELEENK